MSSASHSLKRYVSYKIFSNAHCPFVSILSKAIKAFAEAGVPQARHFQWNNFILTKILGQISTRIVNEIDGVSRVTYDITSKPPGSFISLVPPSLPLPNCYLSSHLFSFRFSTPPFSFFKRKENLLEKEAAMANYFRYHRIRVRDRARSRLR